MDNPGDSLSHHAIPRALNDLVLGNWPSVTSRSRSGLQDQGEGPWSNPVQGCDKVKKLNGLRVPYFEPGHPRQSAPCPAHSVRAWPSKHLPFNVLGAVPWIFLPFVPPSCERVPFSLPSLLPISVMVTAPVGRTALGYNFLTRYSHWVERGTGRGGGSRGGSLFLGPFFRNCPVSWDALL